MINFSEKVILLPAGAKFWQTGESLSKFIGDKSLDFYEGQLALWCPPRPETKLGPTVTATTTALVCTEGETYGCESKTACVSLQKLVAIFTLLFMPLLDI